MESEHHSPRPKEKGFNMSSFDEQKCVGKITDFLKFFKKQSSCLIWMHVDLFVFKTMEESARVCYALPAKRVNSFEVGRAE